MSIADIISKLGLVALCAILGTMGYGVTTWQFWAIFALYLISNIVWVVRDAIRSEEKK